MYPRVYVGVGWRMEKIRKKLKKHGKILLQNRPEPQNKEDIEETERL